MGGDEDGNATSKLELEIEQHVLSTVIKLSDGTLGHVFSRGPKNDAHVYLYNCHLCSVPNLPGERCLQTHIAGKKHQTKLATPVVDATSFRAPLAKANKVQMNIAPGEPVPPGFEDEVKPIAQIQPALDRYKEQALVGLEYIMELLGGTSKEPGYHCVLCNKRGDPRTIIVHIVSYNHRVKFLEKHFPTVTRELDGFRFNRDARNVIMRAVQQICEAIEDTHGRLTPNVHDKIEYNKNPMRFLQEVITEKHIDEKMGPNFVKCIDRPEMLDAIKEESRRNNPSPPRVRAPQPSRKRSPGGRRSSDRIRSSGRRDRRSLSSISSISSHSLSRSRSRSPGTSKRSRRDKPPREQQPAYKVVKNPAAIAAAASKAKSPSKLNKQTSQDDPDIEYQGTFKRNTFLPLSASQLDRQVLPSPKELSQQANEIATERYKWEKFRCLVEIAVGELEKAQKDYEKNPEKHPMYPEEWKKFWNRRYKELQAEKKDPAKHDFKPEWIEFWTRRMKELYDEDIEGKKQEIRKKLGLPDESEEKTEELKEQYTIRKEKSISPIPSEDDDVIIEEAPIVVVRSPSRRKERRSRSPVRRRKSRDRHSPDRYSKDRERSSRRRRSRSVSPRNRDRDRIRSERISRERERISRERERVSRERERLTREKMSRERLSPIPTRRKSPSREMYMELDPYYGGPLPHRRTPPSHYSETYEEWAARYYGHPSGRPRPVYVREPREKEDDNQPLTVVSVLRLLTALEEHLGSLGPKVIDLLAKALALEKVKANSSDDLLFNEDNCVIFETVKEKLKGQLIADVIEPQKIGAVKKAIKNIAAVVHLINEKTALEAEDKDDTLIGQLFTPKVIAPTINAIPATTDDGINKAEIAQKIAASLVAQGKTDVTSEELEVLINAFIEMIKNTSGGDKPVTTASYLKEIEEKPVTPSGSISDTMSEPSTSKPNISAELEKGLESNKPEDSELCEPAQLESLTDSDLQTLLQNFKDLSSEEQHHLIAYLKKLESTDSSRVEKLRKYVNLGTIGAPPINKPVTVKTKKSFDIFEIPDHKDDRSSIFPNKSTDAAFDDDILPPGVGPSNIKLGRVMSHIIEDPEDAKKFLESDDDDDDYTFDDVVKAASQNIKQNSKPKAHEKPPPPPAAAPVKETIVNTYDRDDDVSQASLRSNSESSKSNIGLTMSLADTKNLIASLMGSLQKNVANRNVSGIQPLQQSTQQIQVQQQHQQQQQQQQQQIKSQLLPTQTTQSIAFIDQQNQIVQQQPQSQSQQMPTSGNNLPYYLQQQQHEQLMQQQQQQYPPPDNYQYQNNQMNDFNAGGNNYHPNMFPQQNVTPNMNPAFFNQGNMNYGNGGGYNMNPMGGVSYPQPMHQIQNPQQSKQRGNFNPAQQSSNLRVLGSNTNKK